MQISQSALFRLFCASFFAGLALSLFYDFLWMTQLWLLPAEKRYTVAGIRKIYAKRAKRTVCKTLKTLRAVRFCGDVLFCIVGAITIILLLYCFNNGAFRGAVPLCMLFSFALWRISLSKGVRMGLQWVAFSFETVIYTLILPLKYLGTIIVDSCKKMARKRKNKRFRKQRKAYTQYVIQNIDNDTAKLTSSFVAKMQKGEGRAKQNRKKTV